MIHRRKEPGLIPGPTTVVGSKQMKIDGSCLPSLALGCYWLLLLLLLLLCCVVLCVVVLVGAD
jgi:hypothetical protein